VQPKFDDVFFFGQGSHVRLGDALEDFRDVSQVVGVVRLGRRRLKPALDFRVCDDSRLHNAILKAFHALSPRLLGFTAKHPVHHLTKDLLLGCARVGFNVEDVVVPHVAVGDWVSANAWRTHCSAELHILNKLEFFFPNDVVPSAVVHPLTEQFDWRLRTPFLPAWHVQVVNENDILLAWRRTEAALLPPVHAAVDDILGLVRRRLC
jgi:hypothetical protein